MNQKPKKTDSDSETKKRPHPKWLRDMLTPPKIEPTFVALQFDEAGNVRAVTLEEAQQNTERIKAEVEQGDAEFLTSVKAARSKNRKLLDKRAQTAMTTLFMWAIVTGWRDYGEWLSPDDQWDMLQDFYEDANSAIKRAQYQKAESVIITAAYKFARPFLISYRERRGIPNTQSLSPNQGRAAWKEIAGRPEWARLVERHVRTSRKRRMEKYGLNIPIERMRKQSGITLHNAVNARWEREFPNKNGQK